MGFIFAALLIGLPVLAIFFADYLLAFYVSATGAMPVHPAEHPLEHHSHKKM